MAKPPIGNSDPLSDQQEESQDTKAGMGVVEEWEFGALGLHPSVQHLSQHESLWTARKKRHPQILAHFSAVPRDNLRPLVCLLHLQAVPLTDSRATGADTVTTPSNVLEIPRTELTAGLSVPTATSFSLTKSLLIYLHISIV